MLCNHWQFHETFIFKCRVVRQGSLCSCRDILSICPPSRFGIIQASRFIIFSQQTSCRQWPDSQLPQFLAHAIRDFASHGAEMFQIFSVRELFMSRDFTNHGAETFHAQTIFQVTEQRFFMSCSNGTFSSQGHTSHAQRFFKSWSRDLSDLFSS